jgi:hypothetical protein
LNGFLNKISQGKLSVGFSLISSTQNLGEITNGSHWNSLEHVFLPFTFPTLVLFPVDIIASTTPHTFFLSLLEAAEKRFHGVSCFSHTPRKEIKKRSPFAFHPFDDVFLNIF